MLNNKSVTGWDKGISAQGWAEYESVGDEQLHCTSLGSLGGGFWGKCGGFFCFLPFHYNYGIEIVSIFYFNY